MMGYGGGFGMLLWPVLLAIFVAFIIYFISKSEAQTRSGEDALDSLKKRFARGEIDQGEYDIRRKTIEHS